MLDARTPGRAGKTAIILIVLLAASAGPATAQDRPAPAGEFAAGALLFPDDGVVTEGAVGGTVRFYLSPRISVGPEIAFVQGENHGHLMLTGNVTFDFLSPVNGQPPRVAPFAVVGGGLFLTREEFPSETFWSGDPAFTAGGGVRIRLGKHAFAGAEIRVGWELHIRVNGMVGVNLGG